MPYAEPASNFVFRAGARIQVQTLTCRCCGAEIDIPCNTVTGTLPRQIVHKKAAHQG